MKFLAIVPDELGVPLASEVASRLSVNQPLIIQGSIAAACEYLAENDDSPEYILIDIGFGYNTVFEELEELAQYCHEQTKVVIVGDVNDLSLYRKFLQKGIVEYFVKPANSADIENAFIGVSASAPVVKRASPSVNNNGRVVCFMSAASGDGATTIATNVAYMLATEFNQPTVIVDFDYQYGMVARNLDLISNHGIREVLEQPEEMLDIAFIDKTIIKYSNNLFIISAPKALRFLPKISSSTIDNLLSVLRSKFKNVIIDLPHLYVDWVAHLIGESDRNFMVAQLWIKSAAHASRFLDAVQNSGVAAHKTSIIINRSGSKFKEAITASEFATACKKKIDYYISNESKAIITAENQGKTAVEINNSVLNKQFKEIAESINQISSK